MIDRVLGWGLGGMALLIVVAAIVVPIASLNGQSPEDEQSQLVIIVAGADLDTADLISAILNTGVGVGGSEVAKRKRKTWFIVIDTAENYGKYLRSAVEDICMADLDDPDPQVKVYRDLDKLVAEHKGG